MKLPRTSVACLQCLVQLRRCIRAFVAVTLITIGIVIPAVLFGIVLQNQSYIKIFGTDSISGDATTPLLTLFTAFRSGQERTVVHMNVLWNWGSLKKYGINLLLYNDGKLPGDIIREAIRLNWTVSQAPTMNVHGDPLIVGMYKDAMSRYTSDFYGYAADDILFNEGFGQTLNALKPYMDDYRALLVIGRHTNVESKNRLFSSTERVNAIAHKEGKLGVTDIQSYLIIGNAKRFPWKKVPGLVVHQPGYDSYMIAMSIHSNVTVVDASHTVLAVKQMQRRLMGSDQKDPKYNENLIGVFDYGSGHIDKASYETNFSPQGQVILHERENSNPLLVKYHPLPQDLGVSKFHVPAFPSIGSGSKHLLTIFTTFRPVDSKYSMHINVIKNLALFKPYVQPVLFNTSTDPDLILTALKNGWKVLADPKVNPDGLPFFKDMYADVKSKFHSTFYGFCNGDILFTNGLYDTLKHLKNVQEMLGQTLIIGRRCNFSLRNRTVYTLDDVYDIYHKECALFITAAEDYFFIANGDFPWADIRDVVIGRPAYDNYIVAKALEHNVSVIDVTETSPALHQSGPSGNYDGHYGLSVDWNRNVIGDFNFTKGCTTRAQYATTRENGIVKLMKRDGGNVINLRGIGHPEIVDLSAQSDHHTHKIRGHATYAWYQQHRPYTLDGLAKINQMQTVTTYRDGETDSALLTLFTIILEIKHNSFLKYENTLRNWAKLSSRIHLILFISDQQYPKLRDLAISLGWKVLPVPSVLLLRNLFLIAQAHSVSAFYGYCQPDIIFGPSLTQTLLYVLELREIGLPIITGHSTLYIDDFHPVHDPHTVATVAHNHRHRSLLTYVMCESAFPWKRMPKIEISPEKAHKAVSQLVVRAFDYDVPVVDISPTLPSLQQVLHHHDIETGQEPNIPYVTYYSEGSILIHEKA